MRPRGRQEPLVSDDFVVAQADLMNGMRVVEPVTLPRVRLAEVLPALLVDEDAVPEAEDPIHQLVVSADLGPMNDLEHVNLQTRFLRRRRSQREGLGYG